MPKIYKGAKIYEFSELRKVLNIKQKEVMQVIAKHDLLPLQIRVGGKVYYTAESIAQVHRCLNAREK